MKVRLRERMAGPQGNYAPGQVADVSAETAEELVSGGYAEYVNPPAPAGARSAKVEKAAVQTQEKAVGRRQRKPSARRTKKDEVKDEGETAKA
jgi:hypothetical protein